MFCDFAESQPAGPQLVGLHTPLRRQQSPELRPQLLPPWVRIDGCLKLKSRGPALRRLSSWTFIPTPVQKAEPERCWLPQLPGWQPIVEGVAVGKTKKQPYLWTPSPEEEKGSGPSLKVNYDCVGREVTSDPAPPCCTDATPLPSVGGGCIAPPYCTATGVQPFLGGLDARQQSTIAPRKALLGIAIETNANRQRQLQRAEVGQNPVFFVLKGARTHLT